MAAAGNTITNRLVKRNSTSGTIGARGTTIRLAVQRVTRVMHAKAYSALTGREAAAFGELATFSLGFWNQRLLRCSTTVMAGISNVIEEQTIKTKTKWSLETEVNQESIKFITR
jgi:hypothetical protein